MVLNIRKEQSTIPPHLVQMETSFKFRLEQMPRQLHGGYALTIAIGDNEKQEVVVESWDKVLEELKNRTEEELLSFVGELVAQIRGG